MEKVDKDFKSRSERFLKGDGNDKKYYRPN